MFANGVIFMHASGPAFSNSPGFTHILTSRSSARTRDARFVQMSAVEFPGSSMKLHAQSFFPYPIFEKRSFRYFTCPSLTSPSLRCTVRRTPYFSASAFGTSTSLTTFTPMSRKSSQHETVLYGAAQPKTYGTGTSAPCASLHFTSSSSVSSPISTLIARSQKRLLPVTVSHTPAVSPGGTKSASRSKSGIGCQPAQPDCTKPTTRHFTMSFHPWLTRGVASRAASVLFLTRTRIDSASPSRISVAYGASPSPASGADTREKPSHGSF